MACCTAADPHRARRLAAAVLCLLAAGCVAPLLGPRQGDGRYEACSDPEAAKSWDAARVHVQAGRDAAALPLLRRVVELSPDFVAGHLLYQDTALALGADAAAAMRSYYAARDDQSIVVSYAKARLLDVAYEQNQALQGLLARDPGFYPAHLSMGRLLRARGMLGPAVDEFRRALAGNSELLAAHLELAETLVEWGKDEEAVPYYENYLRGAPNDAAVARAYVALLVYRLGRAEPAMRWIDQQLARDPADPVAAMDKAAALWRAGDPRAALARYLEVLERRPDQARALLNIGFLYYDALAADDAARAANWPKARKAFLLYQRCVRPEDGMETFEQTLAVPFRLHEIERVLGPDDGKPPTLADLR